MTMTESASGANNKRLSNLRGLGTISPVPSGKTAVWSVICI